MPVPSMRTVALLLAASGLGGCASTPVAAPPQIVTVTHVRYVPMPAADLLPCYYPKNPIRTNHDLLLSQQGAIRSLQVCNRQLDDLRSLNAKGSQP